MYTSQKFQELNGFTHQIEKALAQGIHGEELKEQLEKNVRFLDISPASVPGDLIVMDCFAPLIGKISLLVSPEITNEEVVSF